MAKKAVEEEPCCRTQAQGQIEWSSAQVAILRALGDEARMGLVARIAAAPEPVCFCDLVPGSGLAPSTVSHHLKLLKAAGVLRSEKRGRWVYYALEREVSASLASLGRALERGVARRERSVA